MSIIRPSRSSGEIPSPEYFLTISSSRSFVVCRSTSCAIELFVPCFLVVRVPPIPRDIVRDYVKIVDVLFITSVQPSKNRLIHELINILAEPKDIFFPAKKPVGQKIFEESLLFYVIDRKKIQITIIRQ